MCSINHTQKLINLLLLTTGRAKLHSTVFLRRWLLNVRRLQNGMRFLMSIREVIKKKIGP